MQECFEEGAKNGLYEFKGHRAIGGLRAALFCPIPDESVYRLADFLEDFAQKYEWSGKINLKIDWQSLSKWLEHIVWCLSLAHAPPGTSAYEFTTSYFFVIVV